MKLSGSQPEFDASSIPTEAHAFLRHLMRDPTFSNDYLRFFKPEYFEGATRQAFAAIAAYITKYNSQPTKELLIMDTCTHAGVFDEAAVIDVINEIGTGDLSPAPWIRDKAEQFIQRQNYVTNTVAGLEAAEKGKPYDHFRAQAATTIIFDTAFDGLDSDSPDFLDLLRQDDDIHSVIPFDIAFLNEHLGGCRRETLNMIMGSTNTGKSVWLCHLAASYLRRKLNVLYISMEMQKIVVGRRVYANIMDLSLTRNTTAMVFDDDFELPKRGRLMVKTYPNSMAHTGDFRSWIAYLKKSHDFIPDVIVIDYLGICASELMKPGANQQNYSVINSISKELCALARQTNTIVWTGAQANRSGTSNVEIDLTHASDSFSITNHADIILGIWLADAAIFPNTYHVKVLKHQSGAGGGAHGLLHVEYSKMKLSDMSDFEQREYDEAQEELNNVGKRKPKRPVSKAADEAAPKRSKRFV